MVTLPRLTLIVTLCLASALSIAEKSTVRTFDLPDHGQLQLSIPSPWKVDLRQPPGKLPPTLTLSPQVGSAFQILITPMWPLPPRTALADIAEIHAEVASAAKSAESQSVEKALPLHELATRAGRGYYFAATDRAPNPGEYKYLTQGIVSLGRISIAFTVLTNDGQASIVAAALEMLRGASLASAEAV